MLEIGVQSRGIIWEGAMKEGYGRIRRAGMTCVDYNLVLQEEGHLELSHFKQHKECAAEYGLRFSQLHAPIIKYKPEHPEKMPYILEETKKSIEICGYLESPYLVVHPFGLARELGKEEEVRTNLEFFQALAPLARERQVIICIENMPYKRNGRLWESACSDASDLAWYIDVLNGKAGTECFGACFDVGHANVLGKNLREEVKTLGGRLKVLHIHDNDGISDAHQLPYSFSGWKNGACTTDWSGFLLGLREIGYQGTLSFETFRAFANAPGVLLEALLEYVCRIGRNFSRVICFPEEVLEAHQGQKRILFGAGKMFDVYMQQFGRDYPPLFAVDNNPSLWGSKKCGIPIHRPEDILQVPEEERLVILCSGFYEEIGVQLKEMGVQRYELSEEILRMNGKPA